MSVKITKHTSSGLWDGQVYKEFDSLQDAKDWLNAKAIRSEKLGRDTYLTEQQMFLEIGDDDWADNIQYNIVEEE